MNVVTTNWNQDAKSTTTIVLIIAGQKTVCEAHLGVYNSQPECGVFGRMVINGFYTGK